MLHTRIDFGPQVHLVAVLADVDGVVTRSIATTDVASVQSLVELGGNVAELGHREACATLATMWSTLLAGYGGALASVGGMSCHLGK